MESHLSILFITKRFHNRIDQSTEYLIQELNRQVNLLIWEEDGDIDNILCQLPIQPSFILLNDYKPEYTPRIYGLKDCVIPIGAILHEIKYKPYRRKKFYEQENIKYIFTHYRDACIRKISELSDRYIWFPHHVPLDVFKDYEEERVISCLMMGILMKNVYPERTAFYEKLKDHPGFVYRDHPGYEELSVNAKYLVGNSYARELAKAKIFVTCDSVEKLPLMKYFECLACKTLLLASGSAELQDLGFVNEETFIEVDRESVVEKVNYYLAHEEERNRIAQNGFELVIKRHSTKQRVHDLIDRINQIVNNEMNKG